MICQVDSPTVKICVIFQITGILSSQLLYLIHVLQFCPKIGGKLYIYPYSGLSPLKK